MKMCRTGGGKEGGAGRGSKTKAKRFGKGKHGKEIQNRRTRLSGGEHFQ